MFKHNIKGLTLSELQDYALSIGEKSFRGKQLFDWLYAKEVSSFHEMTTLSKPVREKLATLAEMNSITSVKTHSLSNDGTTKYLFELVDGKRIESVLIPPRTAFEGTEARDEEEQQRLTLCVSTQVGCPLDCMFCATASMGFLRNLTVGEIIDQIMQVKRFSGKRITNLVYMGMGEPLLNYENVMNSVEIITTGMNIAARRITISTAGWVPGILRMGEEKRKAKLALSLHSLDDSVRSELMPINKKYPLEQIFQSIEYYYKRVKRRVTFEYILFDGLNDSDSDIGKLVSLSKKIPCKINIIPFHDISFSLPKGPAMKLRPTPHNILEEFVEELRRNHLTVFVRSSAGEDIAAACGQLAVTNEQRRQKKPRQEENSLSLIGAR